MNRIRRSFVGALLALAVSVSGVAADGSSQFNTAYNNYCDHGGLTTNSWGYDIVRTSTQVGARITGAGGKVVARALWPCLDGYGAYATGSLILPANVQGTGLNGVYNFVQAGIGKGNWSAGVGQCASEEMYSDQTHFVYTPDPTPPSPGGQGVYCRATWVDFNNDGIVDNPVGGRTYEVLITEYNSGASNYWKICFTDVSSLQFDCKLTPRSSSDGGVSGNNAAWWGCEVPGNLNNALGVPNTQPAVTMKEMSYLKAGTSVWTYTENSAVAQPWGTNPSYYDYSLSQVGLGEQLSCTTAPH